jgi:transcriptional regulator of acetoin/glycerol metabolism
MVMDLPIADLPTLLIAAAERIKQLEQTGVTEVRLDAAAREKLRADQLAATLARHEWNVARVAREYGVTRTTIYNWMERYAIARQKVKKSS